MLTQRQYLSWLHLIEKMIHLMFNNLVLSFPSYIAAVYMGLGIQRSVRKAKHLLSSIFSLP